MESSDLLLDGHLAMAISIDVLTISNQRYLHCLLSINYYVATLPKGQAPLASEDLTLSGRIIIKTLGKRWTLLKQKDYSGVVAVGAAEKTTF
jgi:hypothetical protein